MKTPSWAWSVVTLTLMALAHVGQPLPVRSHDETLSTGLWRDNEVLRDWIGTVITEIEKAVKEGNAIDHFKTMGQALEHLLEFRENLFGDLNKFIKTIPPGIIPQLKKNAGHGIEGAKKLLEVLTEIKKKGGIKTLEAALEFVENNRDQIGEQVSDFIISRIQEVISLKMYIGDSDSRMLDLLVKVKQLHRSNWITDILEKIISKAQSDPEHFADVLLHIFRPLGKEALQALIDNLEDMKKEASSDALDIIINKIKTAIQVKQFYGSNWIRDILEKMISKAQSDPDLFADVLVQIFRPLGKEALQALLDNLEDMKKEASSDALDIIINKIKTAINYKVQIDEYSLGEWLEKLGDKISQAIENAKEAGKNIAEGIENIAKEALDNILKASSSIAEAKDNFIKNVLPKLIEKVNKIANASTEASEKVAELIVSLLRKLGVSALKEAIDYVEVHKDEIGNHLYDFIISKIQEAIAEITHG